MRIMGIDPGLASMGYADVVGDTGTGKVVAGTNYGVLKTSKANGNDIVRIDMLRGMAREVLLRVRPDFVVIEGWTFMGQRGAAESQVPAVIENVRMVCNELNIQHTILKNGEWKKNTLGSHGAGKNAVEHYVRKRLNLLNETSKVANHVWDARGMALCGWDALLDRSKRLNAR